VSAEKRFRELAVIWKRETLYISNVKKKVTHPAYQQILTMGRDVIPYILQDLKIDPADWFWALTTITGENPIQVSDAGDVHRMASAWIKWGTDQGLLDG
jgi:hypothetical protein